MTTDTSNTSPESIILPNITSEDAAELAQTLLREKAEKDRLSAQEADRVKERVFKSRAYSIRLFTTTGTPILFVKHVHVTNIPEVISYLENEIRLKNKEIYIDADEVYYDPDRYDPEKRAYKRARAEIEAEYAKRLAEVTNPNRQIGDSVPEKLNPASTTSIGAVAAGGAGISPLLSKLSTIKVPGK